jgi:hypothetical protein
MRKKELLIRFIDQNDMTTEINLNSLKKEILILNI